MAIFSDTLADAVTRLHAVPRDPGLLQPLPDAELHALLGLVGEGRRALDAVASFVAAETTRRSAPELGVKGFAAQAGYRRVEDLLQATTLIRGNEAAAMVRVANLTHDTDSSIGTAVTAGSVSIAAADAIRTGLGDPSDHITRAELDQAASVLLEDAGTTAPDELLKRARRVREEIDEAGIVDREAALREKRSLKRYRQPDGTTKLIWIADPATAAVIDQIYDRATSPRRGGPRFVDPDRAEKAKRIETDERTTEQLASDAFTELLKQSATIDEKVLLRGPTPTVKILVKADTLTTGTGHGYLENGEPVSLATVEHAACANGVQQVILDPSGQVLDYGHEFRFFTSRQKQALAIRDGGCMAPDCERPPSWTEAHHIDEVVAHGGKTDLAKGILFCRWHHLWTHNTDRRVILHNGSYYLGPPGSSLADPPTGPPGHQWIRLETKSRAVTDLLTATTAG